MKLATAIGVLVLMAVPAVAPCSASHLSRLEVGELSDTASAFLVAWLAKRDVRLAMRYVDANPLLSAKCDLPPDRKSLPQSASGKRHLIERLLRLALRGLPRRDALTAFRPTSVAPTDWLDTWTKGQVQILKVHHGSGARLICKFEDKVEYRTPLEQDAVVYVGFAVDMGENDNQTQWISAWRNESKGWRLIAIGLLED